MVNEPGSPCLHIEQVLVETMKYWYMYAECIACLHRSWRLYRLESTEEMYMCSSFRVDYWECVHVSVPQDRQGRGEGRVEETVPCCPAVLCPAVLCPAVSLCPAVLGHPLKKTMLCTVWLFRWLW